MLFPWVCCLLLGSVLQVKAEERRLSSSNCDLLPNPANTTNLVGAGCAFYASNAQFLCSYIGFDDEDFQAARCAECHFQCKRSGPPVSLEHALAALPASTMDIRLSGKSLSGSLPVDLPRRFPELRRLDLSNNVLTGTIPASLWQIENLQELDLSLNALEGELKGVEFATKLAKVNLAGNSLAGPLPQGVGKWTKLRWLSLANNKFTGEIPEGLGSWHDIEHINIAQNSFSGAIPRGVGNWPKIRFAMLFFNQLTGSIPAGVGNWTALRLVALGRNQLSGAIPEAVGSWTALRVAFLDHNKLSGAIPAAVGAWSQAVKIYMWGNELTGSIPNAVEAWSSATSIALSRNHLTGSIPDAVRGWAKAEFIDLSQNQLTGSIPEAVGGWLSATSVHLDKNQLTGSIPSAVGSWSNLKILLASENELSGSLPRAVGAWSKLASLYLEGNRLSGPLPPEVAGWGGLEILALQNNSLCCEVPSGIGNWSQLVSMDLSENSLEGDLPEELGKLRTLKTLKLTRNRFRSLPDLGNLTRLESLQAQQNRLETVGSFPPALTELELGHNKLTVLPEAIVDMKELQVLVLANNALASWPLRGVLLDKMVPGSRNVYCDISPAQPRFNWPKLKRLDVSNNRMGVRVQHFLNSLAYVHSLTELQCRNCSLSGGIQEEHLIGLADDHENLGDSSCSGWERPKKGFAGLLSLDLADNNITEVKAEPSPALTYVDFSGNALKFLDPFWFNADVTFRVFQLKVHGNKDLQTQVEAPLGRCPKAGSPSLVADPEAFEAANNSSYECTSLCSGRLTKYTHDSELSVSSLCRCRPGFQGEGRNCTECPVNSYSSAKGPYGLERECLQCPKGSLTEGPRQPDISACRCPAGTYLDAEAAACVQCRQWPYRSTKEGGQQQASACSCNSTYSGLKEADSYCGCDDGWHLNKKRLACEKCSNAEHCLWGTQLNRSVLPPKVKAGFWAAPIEDMDTFGSNSVWRCAGAGSCLDTGRCADGRHGPACGLCQPGRHGGPEGPCEPCPADKETLRLRLLTYGLLIVVPGIILVHVGQTGESQAFGLLLQLRSVRGSMKQMVKHLQTVSVIGGLSVSWPAAALVFFEILGRFTLKLPTMLAAGCLVDETSATFEMWAKWCMPPIFVVLTGLAMLTSRLLAWVLRRLPCRQGGVWQGRFRAAAEQLAMTPADIARVLLFSLTMFWSSLCANSFEALTCIPSPNGQLTIATYPHVQCNFEVPEFFKMALPAFLTIILYLLFPLGVMFCGYTRSTHHIASTLCAERGFYSFLFADFRDGHLMWLLIIMGKDALFVLIPAALPGQGAMQLLLIAAGCTGYGCLVMQFAPFHDRSNSVLEAWNAATASILCVYSAGMGYEQTAGMEDVAALFQDGVEDPIYRGRAAGMVVLQVVTIAVPSFVLLYQLLCAVQRTRKLLPRQVQPLSEEESEEWLRDFFRETGTENCNRLVNLLKKFDGCDMHSFRRLIQYTSATMGEGLSKKSSSALVQMASRIHGFDSEKKHETSGEVSEVGELLEEDGKRLHSKGSVEIGVQVQEDCGVQVQDDCSERYEAEGILVLPKAGGPSDRPPVELKMSL